MPQTIYFCGFPGSGKTYFLRSFFSGSDNLSSAFLFKPLEKGVREKYIREAETDAEIFADLQSKSSPDRHNLYHYQGDGIFEFLGREELNPIKIEKYREYLELLKKKYEKIFIELSGPLTEPITPEHTWADFPEKNSLIFYFFPTDPRTFHQNYGALQALQEFPRAQIVLNNLTMIRDPEWVFYLWDLLQKKTQIPVKHMIPFCTENQAELFQKSYRFFQEEIL